MNDEQLVIAQTDKVEVQRVNPILSLLLFIVSCVALTFSILYYFKSYTTVSVDKVETQQLESTILQSYGELTAQNVKTKTLQSQNTTLKNVNTNQLNVNNKSIINRLTAKTLNIFDKNSRVTANSVNTISFNNNPQNFGYITFKYSCYPDIGFSCITEQYPLTNPNVNERVYLSSTKQLYQFKNKIPPCMLSDTIADQIVDPRCTSKCALTCDIMRNSADSYADETVLNQLSQDKTVNIFNKNDTTILEQTVTFKNISSKRCNVFGEVQNTADIQSAEYAEVEHVIYFNDVSITTPPHVDVYFTTAPGVGNVYNKITSRQWKEKYQSIANTDVYVFCVYNNLDSLLYPDDVLAGVSRQTVAIGVTETTTTYVKIVVSTDYGYKLNSGYTFKYIIYKYT